MPDGPWTKYQDKAPAGPWQNYAKAEAPKRDDTPDPTKPAPGMKWTDLYEMPSDNLLNLGPTPKGTAEQQAIVKRGQAAAPQFIKDVRSTAGAVAGGSAFGAASKGLPLLIRMLASSSGAGAGAGLGALSGGAKPKEALSTAATTTMGTLATEGVAAGGSKVVGKLASPKVDPLQKINKLLGVTSKEVVPGKTPESLAEFAANPARGAMKAGLDEAKLAKMGPLERNAAIMKAKDAAGKQLENVLTQATQAGKTVDLYPTIDKVFDGISDAKVAKETEQAFVQILNENGVTGPLDKVTPTQARAVQRSLESLPKEVREPLRKGISEATRKAVPEAGPADQHYWDLANAAKGTQRLAKQYATTVPENKLRKMFIQHAVKGGGAALGAGTVGMLGYELLKHKGSSTPVP